MTMSATTVIPRPVPTGPGAPPGMTTLPRPPPPMMPPRARVLYRYRTFAERLGPSNAKSIFLHYLGVLALSYGLFTLRALLISYAEEKCIHHDPKDATTPAPAVEPTSGEDEGNTMVDLGPYWMAAVCKMRASNNLFVRFVRSYLDFTSYYVTIFVAVLNTLVMCVLAKHLWRAYWLKDAPASKAAAAKKKDDGDGDVAAAAVAANSSVCIDIGECAVGCLEDNFLIEVILALFDFFRISQTKQD